MHRTNRNNAVCFESLEEALAKCPEAYGHIDLLCAGWPCQDNSIAGKRKGLAGEKSGLWREVARILRLFKPKWFLGENVPGLLSVNGGRDFYEIIAELQEIGYGVSWRILDSQFFGVAQRRRRLFIVGRFGEPCPPEILFEQKGGHGDHKKIKEMGKIGLCISTRDGQRLNPGEDNLVAFTLGTDMRGEPRVLHQETLIAETNSIGEGEIARFPKGLDSVRGILIGNAVSVPVAEWIGKRIVEFDCASRKGKIET